MKERLLIFAIGTLILPIINDPPSFTASADYLLVMKRLDSLEDRVASLEARNAVKEDMDAPAPAAKAKPVLTVHSEPWCGPCQLFKRDVAAAGELPVEIRYDSFSSRVPAFRWTDKTGKVITRTGYTSGTLQSLLKDVLGE